MLQMPNTFSSDIIIEHRDITTEESLSDDNLVPRDFSTLKEAFLEESDSEGNLCGLLNSSDPVLNSGEHSPSILFDSFKSPLDVDMSSPPRKAMKLDIANPITSACLERMNSNELGKFTQKYLPDMVLPSMCTPIVERASMPTTSVIKSGTTPNTPQIIKALFNNQEMESSEVSAIFKRVASVNEAKEALANPSVDDAPVSYSVIKREHHDDLADLPAKRAKRPRRNVYTPDTIDSNDSSTPRQYRVKPATERDNKWRNKRDRNNDSVRRSRQKAKDEQGKRDDEIDGLRLENNDLKVENESLREQVAFLQNLHGRVRNM